MTPNPPDELRPSGFFVLRSPALPYRDALALGEGLEAMRASRDHLADALDRDRVRVRARVLEAVRRPEIREAIFLASPDLEASIERWVSDPDSERGRRTERALVRYLVRMATRSTPFGLFAGCSVGRIGERTDLVVSGADGHERHTRPDMEYLSGLGEELVADPDIRAGLVFRPNSSLYETAGRLRYVESRWDGKQRTHHLVAVDPTPALRGVLSRAAGGATPADLAATLQANGASAERAQRFIDVLIDAQLLVSDLELPVTGPEPLQRLVEHLRAIPGAEAVADALDAVGTELAEIDARGAGADPEGYRRIAASLQAIPGRPELPRLFQTDLVKPAPGATLGEEVVGEIARGVRLLHRIAPTPPAHPVDGFIAAFRRRYEGRWVPLVEALDGESGIGFAGPSGDAEPLLQGLPFPGPTAGFPPWSPRDGALLRKLQATLAAGERELVLEEAAVEDLADPDPLPLPGALAATVVMAAASPDALDAGDFLVHVQGADGPSGARLLGRFCHADPELRSRVEEHLQQEEALDPHAVFAEIVHLPEGRIGNVLLRPVLRDHEIPYLGRSGAPPDRQLPVSDLLVTVEGERVLLRSRRLGRRVVPRLTAAHNFDLPSLPVYRFLCSLQSHGVSRPTWTWGALAEEEFLPRVRSGRIVLSLARWGVTSEELRALAAHRDAALFEAVRAWTARRGLPRRVMLAEFDNRLLVDFHDLVSIESFVQLTKGAGAAVLEEVFAGPGELCVRGPEGSFAHELVVPFICAPSPSDSDASRDRPAHGLETPPVEPVRSFPPGSEWLYARISCGTATADDVLRVVVAPLRDRVLGSGAADSWFFIRYDDPNPHLRVRFHGEPGQLHAEVLPELEAAVRVALDDGRVWRLELDTYQREVQRYGGPEGIDIAERLFRVDSDCVIEILGRLESGDEGLRERWRLTLRGMDRLLSDLGLDLPAKLAVMRRVLDGFAREHEADAELRAAIGRRFREERTELERLLDPDPVPGGGPAGRPDHPLAPGFELLRQRSARLEPVVGELRAVEAAGRLSLSIGDLAPSFLHMHANRMLRSSARRQELILASFLVRLYESAIRRGGG
ncbi:MAG: lantibiotic dehydratase [Actinomycetota bacterium]